MIIEVSITQILVIFLLYKSNYLYNIINYEGYLNNVFDYKVNCLILTIQKLTVNIYIYINYSTVNFTLFIIETLLFPTFNFKF